MTNRHRPDPKVLLQRYEDHVAGLPIDGPARSARLRGARAFLDAHPDLSAWMAAALDLRLTDLDGVRRAQSFVAFAIASGAIRSDAELVLARCLGGLRVGVESLYALPLDALKLAAARLGIADGWSTTVLRELVPLAVAIAGHSPDAFTRADLDMVRGTLKGLASRAPRRADRLSGQLATLERLLYEAGRLDRPAPGRPAVRAGALEHVTAPQVRASLWAYLEVRASVVRPATLRNLTNALATFGEFISERFPAVTSISDLERAHVEAYCAYAVSRTWRRPWAPERVVSTWSSCQPVTALRSFLDDIAAWGWPEAPAKRLVFASDIPRPPKLLPRALGPGDDAALMVAVAELDDRFARDGLTVLRGTGLRIGELLDLELRHLVDYQENGFWLQVPLGKLHDQRAVPIDGPALGALQDWLGQRSPCRALPAPRDGHLADFIFVEGGRRLGTSRLRKGLHDAVRAAGLTGADGKPLRVVAHQLRHTYLDFLKMSDVA